MLDEGKPDLVVAFHNNLEKSRGTKDMLKQAIARKVPTKIIKSGELDNVFGLSMSDYYPNIIRVYGAKGDSRVVEPMKIGPTMVVENQPSEHKVKDHYGSQPKLKRLYQLVENQLLLLHEWDEDRDKIITLWREAHRAKPDRYHEIFLKEKDGMVHGLCQLKPGECSLGIPEHDLSCEECDSYRRIEGRQRCQELYIVGWKK